MSNFGRPFKVCPSFLGYNKSSVCINYILLYLVHLTSSTRMHGTHVCGSTEPWSSQNCKNISASVRYGALSHKMNYITLHYWFNRYIDFCLIGVRISPHFGTAEIITWLRRVSRFLPDSLRHQTKGYWHYVTSVTHRKFVTVLISVANKIKPNTYYGYIFVILISMIQYRHN